MSLKKKLEIAAKKMGAHFTFKGRPIPHSEVFSETGLLPGLSKRADQLASLCLGYTLGATYEDIEKATLGVQVKFDEQTPDIVRLFCLVDVINEIMKNNSGVGAIALDELMYD